jgi:hypothetical protein
MPGIEEVLSTSLDTLDGVPEALHPLFTQDEDSGKYRINGVAPKGKLDEFRTNNRKLHTRAEELEAKLSDFEGLDPKKAREAEAELRKLRDKIAAQAAGKDDGELEKLLGERTERMRGDYEGKLEAQATKAKELEADLEETRLTLAARVIDSEVAVATAGDGFVPQAIEEATIIAGRIFTVREGKAVALEADGKLKYGADGESPLTIREWLASTKKTKPHWWKASANGGGKTADDGDHGGGKTMTRAEHDRLAQTNPAKVRKFFAEGGRLTA